MKLRYIMAFLLLAACSHRTPLGADDKYMYLEECKLGELFCEVIKIPTEGKATTNAVSKTNVSTYVAK